MDTKQHLLLAQVASMYYEQEMTQSEIGKALGLSRVKIYRLLKEARRNRVVQIRVTWPIERHPSLEQLLTDHFSLREAFVLKSPVSNGGTSTLPSLGQLGAQYLEQILSDNMTLAICMGRSTYEVINAISPDFQAHVRVAQATGSIPFSVLQLDSSTLARQLAEKLGGEVYYLSSPLIADNIKAAEVLRNMRDIQRALTAAGQADVALVGIGNLDPQTSSLAKTGFITDEVLASLRADGAMGDIAGRIITAAGHEHSSQYNQRIIGISLDDLRQIPAVIAVAAGREKAGAILGALRSGVINVLCTDDQAAREILQQHGVQQ
jgi:DNA-binding transcriptional regulator LsrR (DeoR family)